MREQAKQCNYDIQSNYNVHGSALNILQKALSNGYYLT